MNKSRNSTPRYAIINKRVPAERIFKNRIYTGHEIWEGLGEGWPIGRDLPPSYPGSIWRDALRCAYCNIEWNPDGTFQSDHIVPKARGGADGDWNRAPICTPCNAKKGAKLWQETLDGRRGYFWDGTPGHSEMNPGPRPLRARDHKPVERHPKRNPDHR
jgi:hypothetical protein